MSKRKIKPEECKRLIGHCWQHIVPSNVYPKWRRRCQHCGEEQRQVKGMTYETIQETAR